MRTIKSKLIDAYRVFTTPYRNFHLKRLAAKGKMPVFVLFYHRIADDCLDNSWTMTNSDFEQQIDWFQQNFEIVDLQECQRRIQSGSNARPTLSITFDDGYGENCEYALPMLIERRIPVTYFVTTHHTVNQKPFPHDVDNGQPLPINTIESLKALDMAGVEIAAHTRTHPSMGSITDPAILVDEVLTASRELEALIGRDVRYFAFPFGQHQDLNAEVFHLLKQQGFLGVCSAYGGYNEIGGDAFHIQRIHGDPSFARTQNWMSYDPRITKVERFDYSQHSIDWDEFLGESNVAPSPTLDSESRTALPSIEIPLSESPNSPQNNA